MRLRTLIAAGLGILAAGAGVVVGLKGGDDLGGVTADPVAVSDPIRAVRLDGTCPTKGTKGPADCQSAIQLDGKCLCLTTQKAGEVENEVTADSVAAKPAAQKTRLAVCKRDIIDPKTGKPTGKQHVISEWQSMDKALPPECIEVCAAVVLPGVSMTAIESGIEDCLRDKCKPCVISAGNWGRCPYCILEDCAKACPVPVEKPDGL